MKSGPRHNYHKGRAAIRHYANQPTSPLWLLRWRPNFTSTYRGPSRGLLHDCTTSPMDRFTTLSYFIEAVNQKRTRFFDRQSIVGTKNCCHVPPSQVKNVSMSNGHFISFVIWLHIVFCRTTFKQQYNHFLFYISIQFQIDWDASLEMHQKVMTTQHLVANNYILNILEIKLLF